MAEQSEELQCQDCHWWLERTEDSNTCFPRAMSYVMQGVNETALPAYQETFKDCPFKEE